MADSKNNNKISLSYQLKGDSGGPLVVKGDDGSYFLAGKVTKIILGLFLLS